MSNAQTEIWLEDKVELGYGAIQEREWEVAEAIVEELREQGFEKEAWKLEGDLNEDRDLQFAQEKGSEDGMDSLSDL
jgi:hypothetical protein